MGLLWWIGGGLAAVDLLVHGILGERFLVSRLRDEGLPSTPAGDPGLIRPYLRVIWHLVTVDLAVSAAILFACAHFGSGPTTTLFARVVAAKFTGYAVVGVLVACRHRRFDAFRKIPQLYLLIAIAVTAALGG